MQGRIKAVALWVAVVSIWWCGCTVQSSSDQPMSNLQHGQRDRQIVAPDPVAAAEAVESQPNTAAPLGSLRGREYTITIYSATDGPRFTIAAADGRVLGEKLSADEIRAQHPTIYETFKSTFAGTGRLLDASAGIDASARNRSEPARLPTLDASNDRSR